MPGKNSKKSDRENSKENKKEKSSEEKKEKSKYGLSKETLEKILESKIHKEKLPKKEEFQNTEFLEEESNFLLGQKNKKPSVSLEAVNFGEENLGTLVHSGWQNENNSENGNSRNGNSFEYIPKNSEDDSAGKKYQSYETTLNIKTLKPEDAASEWSKSFTKTKNIKFVRYEQDSSNEPKYERVFTPKNLNEEEMKNLHDIKKQDFQFQEKKMHYYESEK